MGMSSLTTLVAILILVESMLIAIAIIGLIIAICCNTTKEPKWDEGLTPSERFDRYLEMQAFTANPSN